MDRASHELRTKAQKSRTTNPLVSILTAGRDKPYALGLADALIDQNVPLEFLGSTQVDSDKLRDHALVRFEMFRDQTEGVGVAAKVWRVLHYYRRLVGYAFSAKPRLFHILWNNQFEWFDRTVMMFLYRLRSRIVVLTAHNVNKAKRDGGDSRWNRMTLRTQYRLAHHIFVHTERMRQELLSDFQVRSKKVSVIPFGMNSTVPDTALDPTDARRQLGLSQDDKVLLFFGNIAPYKGLEYLVEAFLSLSDREPNLRLIIAGRPKGAECYWSDIEARIEESPAGDRVIRRIEYVPDEETEIYFKAADVLVLPYTHIFQSGVLFLGYNFGLPVIAADVGSLSDDILTGETGFVCRRQDSEDLGRTIQGYFSSSLYGELSHRRPAIRRYAAERYSWQKVGEATKAVYEGLLGEEIGAHCIL